MIADSRADLGIRPADLGEWRVELHEWHAKLYEWNVHINNSCAEYFDGRLISSDACVNPGVTMIVCVTDWRGNY